MSLVGEFVNYLKQESRSWKTALIYSIFGAIFLVSIPFLIQTLVQQYTFLLYRKSTFFLLAITALFLFGICLMRIFQMQVSERLQRRMFIDGMLRAKMRAKTNQSLGETALVSDLSYFIESISLQKMLIPLLLEGVMLTVQTIVVLILISFYHPFFIIYSMLIAFGIYFVVVVMGKSTLRCALEESNCKYKLIANVQDHTQLNTEPQSLSSLIDNYVVARSQRFSSYMRQTVIIMSIKIIASILLLAMGGLLVVEARMTIGQLIAAEIIIVNLLISLFKFTDLLDYLYKSIVGVHKLNLLHSRALSPEGRVK